MDHTRRDFVVVGPEPLERREVKDGMGRRDGSGIGRVGECRHPDKFVAKKEREEKRNRFIADLNSQKSKRRHVAKNLDEDWDGTKI